eukprot:GFYU01029349.1.p1 GENE.GFYU01029349.1~~GFYU01029349.1.p1  ORF type:complete len:396 (-),score=82.44 GFYU01029349.1:209-1396(-)
MGECGGLPCSDDGGLCVDNKCDCYVTYGGDACDEPWVNIYGDAWVMFQLVFALAFSIICIAACLQIRRLWKNAKKGWSVQKASHVAIAVASFASFLHIAIDPYAMHGHMPYLLAMLLFGTQVPCNLAVVTLIILFWYDIYSSNTGRPITFVTKSRKYLVVANIAFAFVEVIIRFVFGLRLFSPRVRVLITGFYMLYLSVLVLGECVGFLWTSRKLIQVLDKMTVLTENERILAQTNSRMAQITTLARSSASVLLLQLVCLLVVGILDLQSNPWGFYVSMTLFHFMMALIEVVVLYGFRQVRNARSAQKTQAKGPGVVVATEMSNIESGKAGGASSGKKRASAKYEQLSSPKLQVRHASISDGDEGKAMVEVTDDPEESTVNVRSVKVNHVKVNMD